MNKYAERIYSESEIKLIKEIFDMYIKRIYDEDLEKLVLECKEMFLEHQKSLKEIKRLKEELEILKAELRRYKSIVWICEKAEDCDKND